MKQFTPLFLVCFAVFSLLNSCVTGSWKEIRGNHQVVSRQIDVSDYDEIVLSLPANMIYRQVSQESPFLQVSVDENILPSLAISVQGKRLVLKRKDDARLRPTHFVVYTNSRNLSKIEVVGSGDLLLEKAVNARDMEISVTGSGSIKADSLFCEMISVKITGSGDVDVQGTAKNATYRIIGSGDIRATDYLAQAVTCQISGSGNIRVAVAEELDALIAGSGEIRYKGNPESVNTHVAGSGRIEKM